jgi:uncharacterized cupredoxin-like copper-binding protein
MPTKKILRPLLLIAAFAMVLAACGGSSSEAVSDDGSSDPVEHADDHADDADAHADDHADDAAAHADDHDVSFSFGKPGDTADAVRVIEIDANDDFTFGPEEISVSAGETITFVVTNTGVIPHDFTLGDAATQDAHAEEMAEMMASGEMDDHDDPNAVVLQAGESKELTWTFTEAGDIYFGCHQPGHYAAGMVGTLGVTA